MLTREDSSANSIHFKSQVAHTIATLIIELDVLHREPNVATRHIGVLLALALGAPAAASFVRHTPVKSIPMATSRVLRAAACQSLTALEQFSPGLLAHSMRFVLSQVS